MRLPYRRAVRLLVLVVVGMALIGREFYVANTDAVLRFPYSPGATRIAEPATNRLAPAAAQRGAVVASMPPSTSITTSGGSIRLSRSSFWIESG